MGDDVTIREWRMTGDEAVPSHESTNHLPSCVVVTGASADDVRAGLAALRMPVSIGDALYMAWCVIATAYGGDWSQATDEWRFTAERWRDEHFHAYLDRLGNHSPSSNSVTTPIEDADRG